ncbi:MAG TPA: DegQ family serine endoprotease [Pyrinomonadaceae bacterium]|jgi:Do/DeqQ family serine protease
MKLKILSSLFIISSVTAFSGCRTNLFSGEDVPAQTTQTQPSAPPAPVVVDGMRTSYADVVEKTAPAVVQIESQIKASASSQQQFPFGMDDFFNQSPQVQPRQNQRQPTERGVGSGVIVTADGTILTNAHVIEGAERISVQMNDNRTYEAKLIGLDKPSDLAVIKIEAQNLPFLNLGNSDNVRVGDIVLAIGNPLGIGQTVTEGIISAKGRRTGLSDGSYEDFLQTDAPINRGNSGGALVNLTGELIGINSQILSTTGGSIGIGFSIPSNMAKSVMEQLVQNGRVRRGMLGINIQNLTPETAQALDLKEASGVLVSNVKPGSAADKAGLKRGDIVTAINGDKIEDSNVLRNKVAGTMPGNQIKLTVLREGGQQELVATLDEFDSENPSANPTRQQPQNENRSNQQQSGRLGLTLQPLTPEIIRQLQIPAETEGLVVTEVDPGGAAAEKGVVRGDVIMEMNRQAVRTLDEVQAALDKAQDKPVLLLLSRRGQTLYLTVSQK